MEINKLNQTLVALSLSLYILILPHVQIAKSSKDALKAFHCILQNFFILPRTDVLNKTS